jgi:hypothetical protein
MLVDGVIAISGPLASQRRTMWNNWGLRVSINKSMPRGRTVSVFSPAAGGGRLASNGSRGDPWFMPSRSRLMTSGNGCANRSRASR